MTIIELEVGNKLFDFFDINKASVMRLILVLMLIASFNVGAEQHRSQKAKVIFKYSHPCPSTGRNKGSCPDYIIDHIKSLACGGLDDVSNMQWQTKDDAKAKDKWERKSC